jgi:hypothetical protein
VAHLPGGEAGALAVEGGADAVAGLRAPPGRKVITTRPCICSIQNH